MMVTILLGEQGAMIALCSHSDPPLIYSDLRRPASSRSSNPLIYSDLRRPGSSHSGPPLIYSDLRRPRSSHSGPPLIYFAWTTRWTDTHKHRLRGRGRDTIIRHTVQQAV